MFAQAAQSHSRLSSVVSMFTVIALVTMTPCCAPSAGAQTAVAPAAKPSYADESIVIERADSVYTFAADGTGTQERTLAARVQSEAAVKALGVVAVPYAGNSQQVQFVYARVRHADGTVVETQPSDAIDVPEAVTREAPFYSDLKEKQIPIRSLRVGDTLEWKAKITRTTAEAPGQFWGAESFAGDAVVLAETVELRVPAGVTVTVWSPGSKPVESVANGSHIFHWDHAQLNLTTGKEAEADAEAKKKQIWTADQELDAEQGKLPDIAWTTFKSWDEVGAWYRGLEAERIVPSAEVKAKAAELVAGKATDEEKVRALYSYVATQIRYIGVAFGIGRYQPHSAADILANQYGDCKDKHTLLAALLAASGIKADAVLIGAGVRFNQAVPSPAAFNHLITHLMVAGQPTWLDTTTEVAPYRMLFAPIRDKQGLIVPAGATSAYLEKTPASLPFATVQTWKAVGSLDKEGVSTSRITYATRGDEELIYRSALRQVAPSQYNVVIQKLSEAQGYQGTATHPEFSNPEDTMAPLTWSYDYKREQGGDWEHLKMIPQTKYNSLPVLDEKNPPVQTIDLGWPRTETSTAEMKIPDGWTAILPEALHAKSDYATLDVTYRFEKGVVYTDLRMAVVKEKIPAAQWKTYKKFTDDAGLNQQVYIQLVRHDVAAPASANEKETPPRLTRTPNATVTVTSDLPTPGNPGTDAAKMIEQAYNDIEKMDLYNAKELLDQARKLSPDHEYLWNTTGYWHMHNGEMDEALTDYKKELELHPAAFQRMYPPIIGAELVMDKKAEAKDSLRAWERADPTDPGPVAQLLGLLIEDGDAKTAVAEGEAALKRLPADAPGKTDIVRTFLAHAFILSGDKPKGEALLTAVLQESENPGIQNDAAYFLADASLNLPLAEKSVRAALDKLAEESNTWTLNEDPQTLQAKSRSITAAWDTLGWTLFREGKLDEAQSYLRAAWLNQMSIDNGMHLGELLAARGDKAGALKTYQEAIAAAPNYNAMGVRTGPTEKQKQVQALADALAPAKVKTSEDTVTIQAARSELQALRTINLGSAGERNGVAEYRLLLKGDKVVKVEQAGEKSVSGAEELLMKAPFANYFPAGSGTSLVRAGFLNCRVKVCQLALEP